LLQGVFNTQLGLHMHALPCDSCREALLSALHTHRVCAIDLWVRALVGPTKAGLSADMPCDHHKGNNDNEQTQQSD